MCRFLLEQVVAPFFHVVSQAGFFSFVLGNICGGHAGCGGGTGRPEGGAGSHRG